MFGEADDYVFTKDPSQRLKKLAKMTQRDNPLHSNYWRALLCNQGPDFKENFKKMVDYILDERLSKKKKNGV